jgi:hypothetical protein
MFIGILVEQPNCLGNLEAGGWVVVDWRIARVLRNTEMRLGASETRRFSHDKAEVAIQTTTACGVTFPRVGANFALKEAQRSSGRLARNGSQFRMRKRQRSGSESHAG